MEIELGPSVFISIRHSNVTGGLDTQNRGSWVASASEKTLSFQFHMPGDNFLTGVHQPSTKLMYLVQITPHISYKIQPK